MLQEMEKNMYQLRSCAINSSDILSPYPWFRLTFELERGGGGDGGAEVGVGGGAGEHRPMVSPGH